MKLSDISIRGEHLRRLLLDRYYLTQISYPLKETSVNSYFHIMLTSYYVGCGHCPDCSVLVPTKQMESILLREWLSLRSPVD
jgi:hypothetical protein